jgi:general secretion pathway protein D
MVGCANQELHNKGLDLLQEGKFEEGISKLETATKVEPDNVAYRSDWLRNRDQVTNRLLTNASGELALGHYDAAQTIYERILKIDKDNRNAKLAIEVLAMNKRHESIIEDARKLFANDEFDAARTTLKPVLVENNKNSGAVTLLRQIDEQQNKVQMAEPSLMRKFKKPVSLQFRDANVKMVFEALSRTTGINVLLDKDIRPDIKTSIFVKDVSVEDAIDLILMQSQLQKKILSDNTLYIYPDTPAKAKEFQDLKIRSFHLINADPKQMLTMIKTMLKTKDIFIHEKTNSIVMRDTPDAIHLAEKLIADQDIADPEVMLEVEVLEIDRTRMSDIGAKFPSQFSFSPIPSLVAAPGSLATAATTTQLTLDTLRNINGSNISVSPTPSITLNAMLQDSDTNILSSPRLRVRNHEKAKVMIGDRVPIITNSLTPTTTGPGVVTGTVTYQDVGLKFDVEPDIHLDNEVTIKLGLEVSSLGNAVTNSATGSVVYTVQTRNTSTSLRLRDGETQILAGLIEDKDTSTADKVPALGQIPILGHLFSSDLKNKSKKEIILSITPHIVGNSKLADARETEYWSGTESALRSNQIVLKPLGAVSLGNTSSAPSGMPAPYVPPTAATPPVFAAPPTAVTPPAAVVPPITPPTAAASAPVAAASLAAASSPVKATPTANASKSAEASVAPAMALSWQGPNQAKVGEKVTISLNTQSSQGVKTLGLEIGFDPEVLKAIDVNEGDALKRNNASSNMNKNIDQTSGNITVELSGLGSGSSATIVTLTFEVTAVAQGTSVSVNSATATGINGEGLPMNSPDPHVIALTQ